MITYIDFVVNRFYHRVHIAFGHGGELALSLSIRGFPTAQLLLYVGTDILIVPPAMLR